MRGRIPWRAVLLLAAATIWLSADVTGPLAAGRDSNRAETWEFTVPVRFITGDTFDFDNGTSIDLSDDVGWGFGFGYNLNEHLNINMEIAWTSASYDVTWASADDPPSASVTGSGIMDVASTQFNFTYYFMPKSITPYVSAGFGWNWIDSNIPAGLPVGGCYWDPWYGYICGSYQSTYSSTAFTYGLGAGVRIEPKENFFIRFGLNENWQDFSDYSENPDVLSYRLEVGWKF